MDNQEMEGWQLSQGGPKAYEKYLVPQMFAPWSKLLVKEIGIQEKQKVLDAACGTGIVARTITESINDIEVTGLDINQEMISVAREVSDNQITWVSGDVHNLNFSDNKFDVVLCQQGFQFFSKPDQALSEFNRVLKGGGKIGLMIWRSIDHHPSYVAFANILDNYLGKQAGDGMRSPFTNLEPAELSEMLSKAGFKDITVNINIGSMRYPSTFEFVRREALSSPLGKAIDQMGVDKREEMIEALNTELVEYLDDSGIIFPMESFLITGTKGSVGFSVDF